VSTAWKKGARVKDNRYISEGTVIARFNDDGTVMHAAIFVRQVSGGLVVWDQYVTPNKPIGERTLLFANPLPANDGNEFYVVERK